MIGYPDESQEEIMDTINYARECMASGLDASNFFLVMPLPGTKLFDYCVKNGHMNADFDPDKMHWQKANMNNTTVAPDQLEKIREHAWESINKFDFVKYKKNMHTDLNSGEIHKKLNGK